MSETRFPPGWDEARVARVLDHYDRQTDEEAVAEDEASWAEISHARMDVPIDLVSAVRDLIAKKRQT